MARHEKPPPTMIDALEVALEALRDAWSRANTAALLPFRDQVMRIGKEIAALEAEVIVATKGAQQKTG